MVTVKTAFTATWTNNIGGENVTIEKTFHAGERYEIQSRRPEGIMIAGMFIFARHFGNLEF
jgi:hypothetical protein